MAVVVHCSQPSLGLLLREQLLQLRGLLSGLLLEFNLAVILNGAIELDVTGSALFAAGGKAGLGCSPHLDTSCSGLSVSRGHNLCIFRHAASGNILLSSFS